MSTGVMLFNPFTGEPRHPDDIASDPRGILVWDGEEPLKVSQPQRTWQGLTNEDFLEACQIAERGNYLVAFQRIQAKLKEKNT